jgi:hypothetical protein
VEVPDGYQRRLGKALGIPTSLMHLFALTVIVEERSAKRYTEHERSPICDPKTRAVLLEVTQDERWHISWMEEWLMKLARAEGKEAMVRDTLERYRAIEEEVFEEMKDLERDWIGFSFSDYEAGGRRGEGSLADGASLRCRLVAHDFELAQVQIR